MRLRYNPRQGSQESSCTGLGCGHWYIRPLSPSYLKPWRTGWTTSVSLFASPILPNTESQTVQEILKHWSKHKHWRKALAVSLHWKDFCLAGLLGQSSRGSLRCSFIYYVHNSLWNMKAQDKVLTLKVAIAHCVDKAEAPENVHKQKQNMGLSLTVKWYIISRQSLL